MTEQRHLSDSLIERMLARRAAGAQIGGLAAETRAAVAGANQRSGPARLLPWLLRDDGRRRWSAFAAAAVGLMFVAVILGQLGGLAGPWFGAGSTASPSPAATPTPAPTPAPTLTPAPVPTIIPGRAPLQPLAPGQHAIKAWIWPPFTYVVPDGWLGVPNAVDLVPLVPDTAENRAQDQAGGFPITFLWVIPNMGVALADCGQGAEPGLGNTSADIIGAIAGRSGLAVTGPRPVEVGGLPGQQLEVALETRWTRTCPGLSGPYVPLFYSPQVLWAGVEPGERMQITVLDVAGLPDDETATVMILVYSADPKAWDEHLANSSEVIGSFVFDPSAPVPGG